MFSKTIKLLIVWGLAILGLFGYGAASTITLVEPTLPSPLCFEEGVKLYRQGDFPSAYLHFRKDARENENPISCFFCDKILKLPEIGPSLTKKGEKPRYSSLSDYSPYIQDWATSLDVMRSFTSSKGKKKKQWLEELISKCSLMTGERCMGPAAGELATLVLQDESIWKTYKKRYSLKCEREDAAALLRWRSFVFSGDIQSLFLLADSLNQTKLTHPLLSANRTNIGYICKYIKIGQGLSTPYPHHRLFSSLSLNLTEGKSGSVSDEMLINGMKILAARFGDRSCQVDLVIRQMLYPSAKEERMFYLGELDRNPQSIVIPEHLCLIGEEFIVETQDRKRALPYFVRALDALKEKTDFTPNEVEVIEGCFHRLGEEPSIQPYATQYGNFSRFKAFPEVKQDFAQLIMKDPKAQKSDLLIAQRCFQEAYSLYSEEKQRQRVRLDLLCLYDAHPELVLVKERDDLLLEQIKFDPNPQWKIMALLRRFREPGSLLTLSHEDLLSWIEDVNKMKDHSFDDGAARVNVLAGEQYLNGTGEFTQDLLKAEQHFKWAMAREPFIGNVALANLYHILKKHEQAITCYRVLVKDEKFDIHNPVLQQVLVNFGDLLSHSQNVLDQKEAAELFRRVIKEGTVDKSVYDAKYNLALMHMKQRGGLTDTLKDVEKLLQGNPDSDAVYDLAIFHMQKGKHKEAAEGFRRLADKNFKASQNLGVICLCQQRFEEAMKWFLNSYSLQKNELSANSILQCFFRDKEPEDITSTDLEILEKKGISVRGLFDCARDNLLAFSLNAYAYGKALCQGLFGLSKERDAAIKYMLPAVAMDRSLSRIELINLLMKDPGKYKQALLDLLRDTADTPEQWELNTSSAVYASYCLGRLLYEESLEADTFKEEFPVVIEYLEKAIALQGVGGLIEEVKSKYRLLESEKSERKDESHVQSKFSKKVGEFIQTLSQQGSKWSATLRELKKLVGVKGGQLIYAKGSGLKVKIGPHQLNLHAVHGRDDVLDGGRAKSIQDFLKTLDQQ